MQTNIEAVYEKGVLRPSAPLYLVDGTRVMLQVTTTEPTHDDEMELADLLDHEYIAYCKSKLASAPSLKEVRDALQGVTGSLSDTISAERDER